MFVGAARTEDRAHRDAQFAEPPKMVPDQALPLDFCHWGAALFLVRGAPLQYKIGPGPNQKVMGDGHDGSGAET